jgi:two-component system OmpR family response regulator
VNASSCKPAIRALISDAPRQSRRHQNHDSGHIWDYSFDPQTNVVDVLVPLRNKIDRDKKMIRTIRGVGYVPKPA